MQSAQTLMDLASKLDITDIAEIVARMSLKHVRKTNVDIINNVLSCEEYVLCAQDNITDIVQLKDRANVALFETKDLLKNLYDEAIERVAQEYLLNV